MSRPSTPPVSCRPAASRSLLRVTSALAAVAAALTAGAFACQTTESYVYSAQKYDPAADCLAPYAPVETVSGEGAGSQCPVTCLTVGADLYVSTMCPPLPAVATAVAADAGDCIAARAAARRDAGTCDDLGGASPEREGGASEDSGAEEESPDAGDVDAADGSKPIVDAAEAG